VHVPPEQALQHWLLLLQPAPGGLLHPRRTLPDGQQKLVMPMVVQLLHVAPPVPQAWVMVPGWHTPFASQHPLGQVVELQTATHVPFEHWVPVGQATQATPAVPQCWLVLV
jgi:hypothetical protein